MVPARARERILDLPPAIATGGAYHQYQPLTKRGNNDIGGGIHDDPLWLIVSVSAYLEETGDWKILDEPASFDSPGRVRKRRSTTICSAAFRYTIERLGPHGLPLMAAPTGNDCLKPELLLLDARPVLPNHHNKDGKVAESVFIAGLFVYAAASFAAIASRLDSTAKPTRISTRREMEQAVSEHGWDGRVFLRAYDDFGAKIGCEGVEEGKIFIESNGFCGAGRHRPGRRQAAKALAARVSTWLRNTASSCQQPAYSRYYLNLGEISSYPPGYKENAGVFCHLNPWS